MNTTQTTPSVSGERESWDPGAAESTFSLMNRVFGTFIVSLGGFDARDGGQGTLLCRLGKLASQAVENGDICCDLKKHSRSQEEFNAFLALAHDPKCAAIIADASLSCGDSHDKMRRDHVLTPLVIRDGKVYLRRYFEYEKLVAEKLPLMTFHIITGGPGTGKTTLVKELLLGILAKKPDSVIQLAAPTGKAKSRLQESLSGSEVTRSLRCDTLHMLLGYRHGSTQFRHNAENPLDLDVLVVDEVSMVSLPLFAKLLAALPEKCELFLLGDREQLSAVEPGAVLGDLCEIFPEKVQNLTVNHRFSADSAIGRIASAIRLRAPDAADLMLLPEENALGSGAGEAGADYGFSPLPEPGRLKSVLRQIFDTMPLDLSSGRHFFSELPQLGGNVADNPDAVFELLDNFKLLTPQLRGGYGVDNLNKIGMELLGMRSDTPGLPLLICRNDYRNELFNGDIGVTGRNNEVWFRSVSGGFRCFRRSQLPEHMEVLAMTVHKSQGSGFQNVVLLLPPERKKETASGGGERGLLTRELIYTGVTRTKKRLYIFGEEGSLRRGLSCGEERESGLLSYFRVL